MLITCLCVGAIVIALGVAMWVLVDDEDGDAW